MAGAGHAERDAAVLACNGDGLLKLLSLFGFEFVECDEFVVALNLWAAFALKPCRRRLSAMVLRLAGMPASRKSSTRRGAPCRRLPAQKAAATQWSSTACRA